MHADTQAAIVHAIEGRFATHGATPQGLWWPNAADLASRYEAMLTPLLAGAERISLLDVGCGIGFLPDWLAANGLLERVEYTGLDLSAPILAAARARWPTLRFLRADVLAAGVPGGPYDAVLACGLLTCRFTATHEMMRDYAEALLSALWPAAGRCLAFNAMGRHVEWERDDLFHWSADEIMRFCRSRLARHVELRAAYGLWECSYHVWREPRRAMSRPSPSWRDVPA
jgi:SAM-dependent methyltransferase